MERFIRHQNIEHYRALLLATTDEVQRRMLQQLLEEEQAKELQEDKPSPSSD